ncbi:hypothetical protein ADIAL_1351 [Alkalibacterium sp. AK22]|nr:hypothetical protein ADIAL_1351 [Alkalibacterium sp. AK22]
MFLSFSAGVGIAYVFIHLWPQVAEHQAEAEESISWLSGHVLHYSLYITSLFGLALFYTLDRLISRAYESEETTDPNLIESRLFWAHISFFALYNAMIGYLLNHLESLDRTVLIFTVAFGLHFITNDWGLRHHHEKVYDSYGRHVLSLSILLGYLLGALTDLPPYFIGSLEAFIAGGMTLNVIKHELPSERDGNLEGFLSGILSAGILFVLI